MSRQATQQCMCRLCLDERTKRVVVVWWEPVRASRHDTRWYYHHHQHSPVERSSWAGEGCDREREDICGGQDAGEGQLPHMLYWVMRVSQRFGETIGLRIYVAV
jgi:hypothetical protein